MTTEIKLVADTLTIQPGDKLVVVLPKTCTMEEAQGLKKMLSNFAPDADWLVMGGVQVYRKGKDDNGSAAS